MASIQTADKLEIYTRTSRAEIRKEKQVNFLLCLLPVNFAQQILQLDEIVGGRANRVRQRPE